MADKGSFLLYVDDLDALDQMDYQDAGMLLKAIRDYVKYGVIPEDHLPLAANIVFGYIKRHMDYNAQKYAETCRRRSESGKKGGRPKKVPEEPQPDVRQTDHVEQQQEPFAFSEKQMKAKKANGFFEKQTKAKKPDIDIDIDNDIVIDSDIDIDIVIDNDMTPSEIDARVSFLKTMLNLYRNKTLCDPENETRYRAELAALEKRR